MGNFQLQLDDQEDHWTVLVFVFLTLHFEKKLMRRNKSDKLQDFDEMFVHLSIPLCDQGNQLNLYRVHNLPLKVGWSPNLIHLYLWHFCQQTNAKDIGAQPPPQGLLIA